MAVGPLQGSWGREVRAVGSAAVCQAAFVMLRESWPGLKDLLGLNSETKEGKREDRRSKEAKLTPENQNAWKSRVAERFTYPYINF